MKKIAFILSVVILLQYCSLWNKTPNLDVIVKLQRDNLEISSILVFNFNEPGYAEGSGAVVAEMFHLELLKEKKFKLASLYADSPWSRIADTEEKRLLQALEEAKTKQFDYILVGDLREFFYGGMDKTRVYMKIRIIEVQTRTTIFLASNYMRKKGKDPTYPIQTKLSKISTPPRELAAKIVRQFIRKIEHSRR
ncbi:MAG: DUF4823 domain-containing protein [bacterium]|nr:DUF4823 domain-containing protein [bacterium]